MAKSDETTFHGWKITHEESATGKPRIRLSKPGRSDVWIDRRAGTEPDVALQRITVMALELDVAASNPDDRGLWQKRLETATRERDRARAERVALAAVRSQFGDEEGV